MSVTIALLSLLAIFALSTTGRAATYTGVQNVSQDNAGSLLPRIAQDPKGNVHVVWDTTEGSRKVRWRKGTWNQQANRYDFGPSVVFADVGDFQYSTPSIAVAPNGTVLATWSNGFQLYGRQWNMDEAQPSGPIFKIMAGFDSNIAVDSNSHFHVVANGDFQVQYCELDLQRCVKKDAFSRDLNANPDVTVDNRNGVHLAWFGQGIRYRYRPAGGEWGNTEVVGGGNAPQIAADGKGVVHITWSQDYDIRYCGKIIGQTTTGCANRFTADAGPDLAPSIGATRGGHVAAFFFDNQYKTLWANTLEDGAWSQTKEIGDGPTKPDATARPYSNRVSAVWSHDYEIKLATVVLKPSACDGALGTSQSFTRQVGPQAIPWHGLYLPVTFGGPLPTAPTPTPPPPAC